MHYPHKGQWRGALIFSLISVRINGSVNNREAGDLRRYCAHYDVTVMLWLAACYLVFKSIFHFHWGECVGGRWGWIVHSYLLQGYRQCNEHLEHKLERTWTTCGNLISPHIHQCCVSRRGHRVPDKSVGMMSIDLEFQQVAGNWGRMAYWE